MTKTSLRNGFEKACVLVGAAALVAMLSAGCDEGTGTKGLTISPSYLDLTQGTTNQTLTFTVTEGLRTLSLPLEWSVSNPELGTIGGAGGESASYRATTKHGDNTVFVKDQYDAEGVATVRQ